MSKPRIGFVGLGLMGSAMAERLQSCGYPLSVVAHRNRAPVDAALARGAIEETSIGSLAANSEILMICVDSSAAVEAIMEGDDGIIANLSPGTTVVDFGTSLPDSTRRLASLVEARAATMLDAPLGRTPAHAREGLLNIMVGGPETEFAKLKPVFLDLGENIFHIGPIGTGHTLKLINNFYAQSIACAMAEAFSVADRTGLDRRTLYDVMSAGPLRSDMMNFIKAYALDGVPDMLAFSIKNAAKDVGYYSSMTDAIDRPSDLAVGPLTVLKAAIASGKGDHMVPELVDFIR